MGVHLSSATSATSAIGAPPGLQPSEHELHDAFRAQVWRAHGANDSETAELLEYARNAFGAVNDAAPATYPLPDEPFVEAWVRYADEAKERGVAATLCAKLVQLHFPVAAGISETDAYRAATRRGELPSDAEPDAATIFARPEGIRLLIHETAAGRIPVVIAEARADFELLVRALTRRNEPDEIPASMGACVVAGYNNWDRVRALRAAWEAERPGATSEAEWLEHFRSIVPQKERYQDRFIVLSRGPYSAVPASALGMAEDAWLDASLVIRREHECAHYFTRRVFGSMRNSLLDELMADYAGIVAVEGRFRADWFLRFMGLEEYPRFRADGRLRNYRGQPPLSDGAFAVLQSVVVHAARQLERADTEACIMRAPRATGGCARQLAALAHIGIEQLASDEPFHSLVSLIFEDE